MYQVSVIIPIYKVEKYIERCARSLFEQTLESIEFIFVDDCSPDNSITILRNLLNEYPNRIAATKIIKHEHNRGLAAARNTGRSTAQGKYLISCDSDDWVEENMYELMYQKAQQTNADIVICDWEEVYATRKKRIFTNPPTDNIECVAALLSGKIHGSVCNKLIRKELYTQNNITCKEGINFCEDLYVTYRLCYFAKSIVYLNLPLYHYNQTNLNSYTSVHLSKISQQNIIDLTHEVRIFFEEQKEENITIQKAILYLINRFKSDILLNGDISYADQIEKTTIGSIISHPKLPIHYKIVLIFYHTQFIIGIHLIRYLYHKLKNK